MSKRTNLSIYLAVLVFQLTGVYATSAGQQIIFIDPATLASREEPNLSFTSNPGGHQYRFKVDEAQSEVTVTVGIDLPFFEPQADSDSAYVMGWLEATLDSGQAPFSVVHLTDMDLELSGEISLSYWWFLLGEGWVYGTDIGISMYQAGPQTSVVDCNFLQRDNLISGRGTLQYYMPVIGEGQLDISALGYIQSDLRGCVWQDGTTIMLQSEIDMEYPLDVEGLGQVGTAWLQGAVVAKAEVFWSKTDLNNDGFVDFIDFAILASAWFTAEGDSQYNQDCDISDPEDGYIDGLDLAVFAGNWLEGFDQSFTLNPNSKQDVARE